VTPTLLSISGASRDEGGGQQFAVASDEKHFRPPPIWASILRACASPGLALSGLAPEPYVGINLYLTYSNRYVC
jgi:hypothetical protein